MTRRRRENEEFAMFLATIIPHTGPLLLLILLCYILPFPSDCQPTLTPLRGSKVYVIDGSSFHDLTWNYNTDGRTIKEVQLKYIGTGNFDITVAGRTPTGQLQVNPASGYSASRISYSGSLPGNVGQIAFRISNIVQSDSRIFKCDLSFNSFNPPDIQSSVELVVVVTPRITLKSQPQTIDEGDTTTLLCAAIGNPKPTITWTKGSTVVQQTSISNYTILSATKDDAGTYTCTARITVPGLSVQPDNYQVTVTVRHAPTAATFTTGTPSDAVVQGTAATLTCSANGYPPPRYTIKLGNTTLVQNSVTGRYDITNVQLNPNDGQQYFCEPSNAEGSGPTQSLTLTVNVRPRFNPPQTLPTTKQTKNEDQSIDYTCEAEAKPPAKILWMLNGKNLTNNPSYMHITERIAGPSSKIFKTFGYLNIRHLTWQQYGKFSCVAINDAGSAKQNTELEVRYRPVVQFPTDHPQNLTLAEGETATFYCKTIGNPATTAHKWQFNGNDLQGEACDDCPSTTLRIGSVRRQDEGLYGCVGTNSMGNGPPAKAQLLIKHSTKAPLRGTVKARRMADDPTIIAVTWTVIDSQVSKMSLEIQRGGDGTWSPVSGANNLSTSITNYNVTNLKADAEYKFRLDMRRPEEDIPSYAESNEVIPVKEMVRDGNQEGLSASEVSGIIIGILLVVILALTVHRFWRKKRGKKNDGKSENPVESRNNPVEIEDELDNDNFSTASGLSNKIELRKTQQPPHQEAQVPPYLEYASMHPATWSWEVPRENVIIETVIGQGTFGQVARGTASQLQGRRGTSTVAIKMLNVGASNSDRKDLLSELEVMKTLQPHPHVIKLLGCVTESDPVLVITEYVPYGDLLGYLRKSRGLNDTYYPDIKPQTTLTSQQLMKFAWQIADGMSYLSSKNIVHRDLAARNVLVGDQEICRVTDFGMARDVHQENICERKIGGRLPVKWTAYEALMYGQYTEKSDVWSFGVVLYEIITLGGSPYPRTAGRKMAELLLEGYRMPKPTHVDDTLYQTMLSCWQEDPDKRPTFEALSHELKEMENQPKTHIKMFFYDKQLYENVEDLTLETGTLLHG